MRMVYASNKQPAGDRLTVCRISEDGQKFEILVYPKTEGYSEIIALPDAQETMELTAGTHTFKDVKLEAIGTRLTAGERLCDVTIVVK